jgi:hypothetical protein
LLLCFFGDAFFDRGNSRPIDVAGASGTVVLRMVLMKPCDGVGKKELKCELWCKNQYGNRIMVGSACQPMLSSLDQLKANGILLRYADTYSNR